MQAKVEICGVNTSELPVYSGAQTDALLRRAAAGDRGARDELIRGNLRLVLSVVQRFRDRGESPDDLFQVGCIGLMKSIDHFNTELGVRFSTYAVPVILGEMRRLFRDGGTVKVSRSLKELSLRVVRGREQLAVRLGRDPTIEELAEELGLTREEVVEALNVSAPPLSLTVSSEEGETQIDLPVQSPEENLSERMALRQILGELEPRDRQLIILRYFMDKTQTQTAEQLGMTQVQVSRREKKLLLAMRQKFL